MKQKNKKKKVIVFQPVNQNALVRKICNNDVTQKKVNHLGYHFC